MGEIANDNYPTEQPLADAITKFCFELFPEKRIVIEPSCGDGAFLKPAQQLWTQASFLGVDLVNAYRPSIEALSIPFVHADFLQYAAVLGPEWFGAGTLVITNPPYDNDLPQRFVEVISQNSSPGCHIALLLRQSMLGGIGRAIGVGKTPKFKERSSLRIKRDIAGRPKFRTDKKNQDNSEYAVFIFETGYHGHYIGWEDPLVWKPKHLKKLAP